MAIYSANGREFDSFLAAVRYADEVKCDVIQIDNGKRRWTPAKVNPKAARMYRERKAAYEAQLRAGK